MNILENYLSGSITKVKDTFMGKCLCIISKNAVKLVGFIRKFKLVYRSRQLSWERRSKVAICKCASNLQMCQ